MELGAGVVRLRGAAPSPSEKNTFLSHTDGALCLCGSVLDRDSVHAFNDAVEAYVILSLWICETGDDCFLSHTVNVIPILKLEVFHAGKQSQIETKDTMFCNISV